MAPLSVPCTGLASLAKPPSVLLAWESVKHKWQEKAKLTTLDVSSLKWKGGLCKTDPTKPSLACTMLHCWLLLDCTVASFRRSFFILVI